MPIPDINKNNNEPIKEYFKRLCVHRRDYGLRWEDVAEKMSEYTGLKLNADRCRKWCSARVNLDVVLPPEIYDRNIYKAPNDDIEPNIDEAYTILQEVKDYQRQINFDKTRMSREDTCVRMAREFAAELSKVPSVINPTKYKPITKVNDDTLILMISDWHYGIEINLPFNKFNPDIARERINNLYNQVKDFIINRGITNLVVLNLGDIISGRIHAQIRIQNRINVIQQLTETTKILRDFLDGLEPLVNKLDYYYCLDNHSRIEPNKKDSLDLESLAVTQGETLKLLYEKSNKVIIHSNDAPDIIHFTANGWNIAGVHGDKDKPVKIVSNISLITNESYDLICTAHLHHFSADEQNKCIVISNPALMGTDEYAYNLRFTSYPAQILIVCTDKSPVAEIHRLILE